MRVYKQCASESQDQSVVPTLREVAMDPGCCLTQEPQRSCSRRDQSNSLTPYTLGTSRDEQQAHLAKVGEYIRDNPAIPHDVVIVFKNGSRKPAHYIVLGAHSKYFADKNPRPNQIDASFARQETVESVLNYLYTGRININLADLPDYLHICNEWNLFGLRKLLEDRLAKVSFTVNCVIHCLNIAGLTRANVTHATKAVVLNNCNNNFTLLLEDRRFPNLKASAVELLLMQDNLPVNSEVDVGRILLLLYAQFPANRVNLPSLLHVIRREHMNSEDFVTLLREVQQIDQNLVPLVQKYFVHGSHPAGTKLFHRPARRGSPQFSRKLEKILNKRGIQTVTSATPVSPNPYQNNSCPPSYGSPINSCADSVIERGRIPNPFSRPTSPAPPSNSVEPNAYKRCDASQKAINRYDLTRDSVYELGTVPDLFGMKVVASKPAQPRQPSVSPNPYNRVYQNNRRPLIDARCNSSASGSGTSLSRADSLADLAAMPCPFVEAQGGKTVNKRLVSKNSFKEIRQLPNVSRTSSAFNTVSSNSADTSSDERSASLSGSTARSSMNSFVDSSHAGIVRRYSNTSLKELAGIPSISQISIGDVPTANVYTARSPGANTERFAKSPLQMRYPAENGWSAYGSVSNCSQPTSGVLTAQSFTESMHERARAAGCPAFNQPSSDVDTAISYGEVTKQYANNGNFSARQRAMEYPAAVEWNAYGQVASSVAAPSSQCLSLNSFSPTTTSTPNSSASSVTTADVYSRALPRYVPTNNSLADIHALPNPFVPNFVSPERFSTIRPPTNASSISNSMSSVSSSSRSSQ